VYPMMLFVRALPSLLVIVSYHVASFNFHHTPVKGGVAQRQQLLSKLYSQNESDGSSTTPEPSDGLNRRDAAFLATAAAFTTTTSLLAPSPALADDEGRKIEFTVQNLDGLEGLSGTFVIQMRPTWAPIGAQRFEELTEAGFWNDCRIFRVIPGFISQFGINGDPKMQAKYKVSMRDDPVRESNSRGTVVFATAGPNTRTTQIFINTNGKPGGNSFLDKQGFSPFGEVISGMDVVDRFYSGYGEGAPSGRGPDQGKLQSQGAAYVNPNFPKLSYYSDVKFII